MSLFPGISAGSAGPAGPAGSWWIDCMLRACPAPTAIRAAGAGRAIRSKSSPCVLCVPGFPLLSLTRTFRREFRSKHCLKLIRATFRTPFGTCSKPSLRSVSFATLVYARNLRHSSVSFAFAHVHPLPSLRSVILPTDHKRTFCSTLDISPFEKVRLWSPKSIYPRHLISPPISSYYAGGRNAGNQEHYPLLPAAIQPDGAVLENFVPNTVWNSFVPFASLVHPHQLGSERPAARNTGPRESYVPNTVRNFVKASSLALPRSYPSLRSCMLETFALLGFLSGI